MGRSQVTAIAKEHIFLYGKMYHQAQNSSKVDLHPGMMMDCEQGCEVVDVTVDGLGKVEASKDTHEDGT